MFYVNTIAVDILTTSSNKQSWSCIKRKPTAPSSLQTYMAAA